MIVLDLCQLHYQVLKLTKKNAKHAWMKKNLKFDFGFKFKCDFIGYKNNNFVSNVKNVKEYGWYLHYHVLLIAYLKLTKKNAKHAWKQKILTQNVILLGLKINN